MLATNRFSCFELFLKVALGIEKQKITRNTICFRLNGIAGCYAQSGSERTRAQVYMLG